MNPDIGPGLDLSALRLRHDGGMTCGFRFEGTVDLFQHLVYWFMPPIWDAGIRNWRRRWPMLTCCPGIQPRRITGTDQRSVAAPGRARSRRRRPSLQPAGRGTAAGYPETFRTGTIATVGAIAPEPRLQSAGVGGRRGPGGAGGDAISRGNLRRQQDQAGPALAVGPQPSPLRRKTLPAQTGSNQPAFFSTVLAWVGGLKPPIDRAGDSQKRPFLGQDRLEKKRGLRYGQSVFAIGRLCFCPAKGSYPCSNRDPVLPPPGPTFSTRSNFR